MLILIKTIGIAIAGFGIACLVNPKLIEKMFSFWEAKNRIYIAGVIRILIGIILLQGASESRWVGAMVTLGILFLIGGVLIFVLGPERVKRIIDWYRKRPPAVMRLLLMVAVLFGALIVYSA